MHENQAVEQAQATTYGIDDEVLAAAEAARALQFIESHLFERLSVACIARACGASAFHFSRRFTARQGETVMAYVRGRRLEVAASRLVKEPQISLATIALDCGFDSQAGFTRAFARAFGEAPSKYRRAANPRGRKRRITMSSELVLHESLEHVDTLHVAGVAGRFDPSSYTRVPELWKSFVAKMQFAGRLGEGETCGVFRDRDFTAQSFEHLAGARIAEGAAAPKELAVWTLPARSYLVFKQMLHEGELHPQVAAATTAIWGERLARSGRTLAKAPDFQIYPANFKVAEGGWLAYYIPVES